MGGFGVCIAVTHIVISLLLQQNARQENGRQSVHFQGDFIGKSWRQMPGNIGSNLQHLRCFAGWQACHQCTSFKAWQVIGNPEQLFARCSGMCIVLKAELRRWHVFREHFFGVYLSSDKNFAWGAGNTFENGAVATLGQASRRISASIVLRSLPKRISFSRRGHLLSIYAPRVEFMDCLTASAAQSHRPLPVHL